MECSDLISDEVAQAIFVCATSSFHWVQVLAPVIISISVIVAICGVLSARATARQRATLDMIEKVESTQHYQALHAAFSYHRRQLSFGRLHDPQETKDKSERQSVLDYINHYELVSIGIRKKILDDQIYREWMRGPFVRDWNAASSFIQRERWKWDEEAKDFDYHAVLYENFQVVAKRWSNEAVDLNKSLGGKPKTPAGPGDEALPNGDSDQ